MVFQALDQRTDQLVALRRYFLEEDVLSSLKEKGESGMSLYEEGLAWMKSLDLPHLRKVLDGGFDDVDGTPFFVTEWISGSSLEQAHEDGAFAPGEGQIFETQARATLLGLPVEARPAVLLEDSEVIVNRDQSGQLETSFLISPLRYFGAKGGMEFESIDRQETLREMVARFPQAPALGMPSETPVPQLKSAHKGGGKAVLWGSLAALLALLGIGGWMLFGPGSAEKEETIATKPSSSIERSDQVEAASNEVTKAPETVESTPKEQRSAPLGEVGSNEAERVAAMVAAAQKALEEEEKPVAIIPPDHSKFVVEDKPIEGEVDLFGEEDLEDESVGEMQKDSAAEVVGAAKESFDSESAASGIATVVGEPIVVVGIVEQVSQSGSGIHWYLEFNKGTPEYFMVVFKHEDDKSAGTFAEWETLVNKKVRVDGVAEMFNRGGMKPALRIGLLANLEVLADLTVHSVTAVAGLLSSVSAEQEVRVEGTLSDLYGTTEGGYLVFEESPDVQGRFWLEGALGSDSSFRKQLVSYKGKKIRLTGRLQQDANSRVSIAIQLEKASDVTLVE